MNRFDKKIKMRINAVITLMILFGFSVSVIVNTLPYNEIIKEDIKNISKLSSSNIYSEINNELVKPLFVSLTMANDSFLKAWLKGEENPQEEKRLLEYLDGLRQKYGYGSVFLISDETKNYYHYQGLHKTIQPDDDHDQWYYDFIESGKSYELDVDTDQAQNNVVTVFVNCRIENEDKELMGVVGVGLRMNEVQEILGVFEDAYELESFLVDQNGLVQVHTNNQLIESYSIYQDETISQFVDDIFANQTGLATYRYEEKGIDGYLITRYIEDLDWTLVVKKDTSVLRKALYAQIAEMMLVILLVILAVIWMSNRYIHTFQEQMVEMAKTDELTGLMNRRGFNQLLYETLKKGETKAEKFSVFLFDIDNFKALNDQYGHLFGDKIISHLASQAGKTLGDQGMVSRWGGDEYVGILDQNLDGARALLADLQAEIAADEEFGAYQITISVGITEARHTDTLDMIMGRVDRGLYQSKEKGKNCITVV